MSETDIASVITTLGPSDEHRKQVSGSFFGTLLGQSVVLLGLLVAYVASLALLYKFFSEDLRAFHAEVGSIWFWSLILAPMAFIIFFSMIPTGLKAWRMGQLYPLATTDGQTAAGYFRLFPYGAQDSARYHRPDGAAEQALQWLLGTKESLLYLVGASGSGKSSLIGAGVVPHLQEEGWAVLQCRVFDEPVETLRRTLLSDGSLFRDAPAPDAPLATLLTLAGEKRRWLEAPPLLIIIDQFEEFLILHEAEDRREFADLLEQLADNPVDDVKLLLVIRSDYRELLFKLKLPDYRAHENAFELASFFRVEAEDFLKGGGKQLTSRGYDALFKGLDRIELTRGLYRPITLNMVGMVLDSMGSRVEGDPANLIGAYLRNCLVSGKSQDFSKQVLAAMITAEGTKEPRSEAQLAGLPGIEEWQVRATLAELEKDGLVRPLAGVDRLWEISHDFLARAIGQILGQLRPNWIRRFGPIVIPAVTVGWLIAILLGIPLWLNHKEDQALRELRDLGFIQVNVDDGTGLRIGTRGNLDDNDLSRLAMLARHLREPLTTLNLTDEERITDLGPLQGMPLTRLDLSNADGITDLGPLQGMPLTRLDLSSADGITDLGPLQGMPLTRLDLSSADGITDLGPLQGMPLTRLDLRYADGITDLGPLQGLPLTSLDLSSADGITDLGPLQGLPLTALELRNADGITDLSPLQGMPLTSLVLSDADGITDLGPLQGMRLEYLGLSNADGITDLGPLQGLPLTALELRNADGITDLSPLQGMRLEYLGLNDADGITDLGPLQGMPLTTLVLSDADGITDLGPLQGMPLTTLVLSDADGITDLGPLQGMPLTGLDLINADGITDLGPLQGMPLTSINLSGADGITDLGPLKGMNVIVLGVSEALKRTME